MDAIQSKKLTTLSIGTIVVVGAGKSLIVDGDFPPFRFWVAAGATGFILAGISDIEPTIGAGLAILAATVVMFESGEPLLRKLAQMDQDAAGTRKIRNKATRKLARQLTVRGKR